MKKALSMLLTLMLLAAMVFGATSALAEGKKFGSTYMTMNNPFFIALNDGIKSVVEANGDTLITLDPALDQAKQISQIEDMVAQNVDAIFLNPVDWQGVRPALEVAKAAGIPIINVDAPVFDQDLVECIVASDNYKAGVVVAEDIMKKLPAAKIVLLEHPTAKSALDRTQSLADTIEGNDAYQIIARESSEGQLEQAMPKMENILQAHPDVDVVMGVNDPSAMGALAAIEAAKIDRKILIYGVDGAPEAKQMIKEGKLEGSAAQSPKTIGTTAAELAYKLLAGETIEKLVLVPVTLITAENVDQFGLDGWQ